MDITHASRFSNPVLKLALAALLTGAISSLVACGRLEPVTETSPSLAPSNGTSGAAPGDASSGGDPSSGGSTNAGSGASSGSGASDSTGSGPATKAVEYNDFVLQAVASMPSGGGYSTSSTAFQDLKSAITISNGNLAIGTQKIQSFCSGATYLAFLKTLSLIQKANPRWNAKVLDALLVSGQADGTGVWGRWNSNGPGTGRLFYELKAGVNFDDFAKAKPGDFLKIWWDSSIGSSEHGHSVIYMGTNAKGQIGIWSSNSSNPDGTSGMGIKWYNRASLVRVLFSRLTNLDGISNALAIPKSDQYLADMLRRPSTPAEMKAMVGLAPSN